MDTATQGVGTPSVMRSKSEFLSRPLTITLLLIGISMLTRITLMLKAGSGVDYSITNVLGIFGIGLFYDFLNSLYFLIPVMLLGWLTPTRYAGKIGFKIAAGILLFILVFLLLLNAVSEWVFWDEFGSRFNFIAVDYLVYTQEVVGNIRQSYPVEAIIGILLVLAVLLTVLVSRLSRRFAFGQMRFGKRSLVVGVYFLIVTTVFLTIDNKVRQFSRNVYVNELAGNGMYELFAAYLNNELDYNQFYIKLDEPQASSTIRSLVKTPESRFIDNKQFSIERDIVNTGAELHKNIILISVESLSADFLGSFGNTQGITPALDSLARQSLLFTNLYATGTRTVRGLEALSICTPPTPGQSIVRRPHNEGLFSMGSVLQSKGYQTRFIYGGYGYFDNMGYFFGHNSYGVVDRTALSKKEIDYENIWGVADENLFELATREIGSASKTGKPVFAHIMTTSNHRPYTYPEGRIDIPSHTSREGAVKYTDFAIGQFIRNARNQPWFKNTLFIIVADHCASSAGKTDLPVNKYKIPLMMYAPGFIEPGVMPRLMSQIDIGPTVLGLLNFSYRSKFFGYDIFKLEPGRERAFVSTYQSLGYIKHDSLIVLKPQRLAATFTPNFTDGSATPASQNTHLLDEAIAWYQSASFQFRNGLMKK
ncbi:phosphoglycerol transferase MdoB-like AlkP superfamily enzyme [Dyadobacter sp. BE34]|uniref:Phosphoglycerol transferase MdoB-like AlkP superfamily enzyme n=1 Tax=Dyadobacter fermentans TaxID=94254 RepID=A0ABU1QXH3_9BACT|nr:MULTISPECIES: LTA synthase family protein [Dyadobacter]MDR6805856.1 phosphoglycerol transferase MdoB-like AlkP superfamily enzyme [Dyadobacter fermentans]MDR7042383.1 phosphoglycerol transferase MdoB-like AlkP superfamily enzyme [Dyadobacter sp. BE242]MDR7201381.1 phosphoglycerol transferase MdoB-like AlkP superfamily enzyme [Dyadobacter sp. BE34]MDR7215870.1 phosphoglycerol transferase MdoB-like AlkP superfamily enzyme [Dyadobacter sp. BE31]MDR7263406.1 phosphoglycerol transferase MdoB-lik